MAQAGSYVPPISSVPPVGPGADIAVETPQKLAQLNPLTALLQLLTKMGIGVGPQIPPPPQLPPDDGIKWAPGGAPGEVPLKKQMLR